MGRVEMGRDTVYAIMTTSVSMAESAITISAAFDMGLSGMIGVWRRSIGIGMIANFVLLFLVLQPVIQVIGRTVVPLVAMVVHGTPRESNAGSSKAYNAELGTAVE
jgi:hypothetical protein